MRDDDKTDLPGWLGLRSLPDFTKARWLGPLLTFGAVLVVGGLFLLALVTAFTLLSSAAFGSLLDDPRSALGVGGVTVALIGAPFVIWRSVVAQKTVNVTEQGHITDRINTAVQGLGAEKTVKRLRERTREPAKVTYVESDDDKFKNSQPIIEEVTEPNLEVRIGAIYALERIAHDSDRDHVQIMEILCAYIRQNAPAPETDDWPELEMKDGEDIGPLEVDWDDRLKTFRKEQYEKKATLKLREDIQVALTVIGRRSAKQRRLEAGRGVEADCPFDVPCPEHDEQEEHDPDALGAYLEKMEAWKDNLEAHAGYRLDLRSADLRGADLAERDLQGAKLNGTYLQGADLREARLQGADLRLARLQGAGLEAAQLQGANLEKVRLQGANLLKARLQGAGLSAARLQDADLWQARLQGADAWDARMQGAFLRKARLQGAHLGLARLQGANLAEVLMDAETNLEYATFRRAAARSTDFTGVPQIAEYCQEMFGDASVTLPGGHGPGHKNWPEHWPKFELGALEFDEKLGTLEFREEWRKWQADPRGYLPPERQDPGDTA